MTRQVCGKHTAPAERGRIVQDLCAPT
jgi:hypothetical protein